MEATPLDPPKNVASVRRRNAKHNTFTLKPASNKTLTMVLEWILPALRTSQLVRECFPASFLSE